MVDSVKAGTLAIPPTVEQPKPVRHATEASEHPVVDAPKREKAALVHSKIASSEQDQKNAASDQTDQDVSEPPKLPQEVRNASVATYRDSESGRLIVRIFDEESGEILVEFPPEDPPINRSASPSVGSTRGNTGIDV